MVKGLKRQRAWLHWEMEHSEVVPKPVPNMFEPHSALPCGDTSFGQCGDVSKLMSTGGLTTVSSLEGSLGTQPYRAHCGFLRSRSLFGHDWPHAIVISRNPHSESVKPLWDILRWT